MENASATFPTKENTASTNVPSTKEKYAQVMANAENQTHAPATKGTKVEIVLVKMLPKAVWSSEKSVITTVDANATNVSATRIIKEENANMMLVILEEQVSAQSL